MRNAKYICINFIYLFFCSAINPQSVSYVVKLIEPHLITHGSIQKEYNTLNTIVDLDIQNDDELISLGSGYIHMLKRKNEIIDAYNKSPMVLDRLIALITDLYVDFNKIKGANVRLKIPELVAIINDYNYKTLIAFLVGGDIHGHGHN